MRYQRGKPDPAVQGSRRRSRRGTKVTFKPDTLIFEQTDFSFDILSQRLRELAFLNRGVRISIDDQRTQKQHEFFYKGGIEEFVKHLNRAKTPIHPQVVYLHGERDGFEVEVAMQWNEGYTENVYSFANNINTIEGGTHLIGLQGRADAHDQHATPRPAGLLKKDREAPRARTSAKGSPPSSASRCRSRSSKGRPRPSSATAKSKGSSKPLVNEKLGEYLEEHPSRRQEDLR